MKKFFIKNYFIYSIIIAFIGTLIPFLGHSEETKGIGSLDILKNEIISYFRPVSGKVISVDGNSVKINIGTKDFVRPGMRLYAFKKGAAFIHPVTKEPMGNIELPIGNIEIISADISESFGIIIKGKPEDFSDAFVKITETKIRLLFYQGNVDWFLGDSYFHALKESGRFELLDIAPEIKDISNIISEARAKGATIVLVLNSEDLQDNITITQKLIWVDDSKQFSEKSTIISASQIKELRYKSTLIGSISSEPILSYRIPFGARQVTTADIDGDGNEEIIFSSGDKIRIFSVRVDLKLLWEFKVPSTNEILWIDVIDINRDKKDEILITSYKDGDVTSYIYEVKDNNFIQLWRAGDIFIRRLGSRIIAQEYTKADGYHGKVFNISYNNGIYKKDKEMNLPEGINIYDYQIIRSPDGRQGILSWDENGYIHLFNEKGSRIWVSKENMGGFLTEFKKESLSGLTDKGKWSVKDRLIIKNNEVFVVKRKPLVSQAKGLGYKNSEIRSLWWNGINVEENTFIESIDGEVLDYAISSDRIFILTRPLFGITPKNILKGENPFGLIMHIFSLKGR